MYIFYYELFCIYSKSVQMICVAKNKLIFVLNFCM
jgi:hypothetical protein